ncbi:lactonase family protein [Roseateles sp. BYS180W]|uniref:Lactonase family protein n=1 Tax=Roseateles rivi TaxID=3299028 RepID=A0ABW7FWX6_9BURK
MTKSESSWMLVGSCNRAVPYFKDAQGEGISTFGFDAQTGRAQRAALTQDIDNPTFVSVLPQRGLVLASSEVPHWLEGLLSVYRIDPDSGRLNYLNKQTTLGNTVAQHVGDASARHAWVVNYSVNAVGEGPDQGLSVLPLAPDGRLLPARASAAWAGQGPVAGVQERAHPHAVQVWPDERHLLVADLGCDALLMFRWDAQAAQLELCARLQLAPGAGPRHLAVDAARCQVYVANQIDATLATVAVSLDPPELRLMHCTSTLPPGVSGEGNHVSEVQLTPDGDHVLVGNRGHDSLAVYRLSAQGQPELQCHVPAGGRCPRHFAFDPSGRWLVVALQDSHVLQVMRWEPELARLSAWGEPLACGSPTCVAFMPLA